ncbi:MAG: hypothetical protein LAO56_19815 [Acidobacteriia bacterium]|nr:hypothetical protein [Terriglobia bacterium]
MYIQDLAKEYLTKTDEELLQLAANSEQLTSDANTALTNELAKRRVNVAERVKVFRDEEKKRRDEPLANRGAQPPSDSHRVGPFVTEVLHVYHNQFWLFVKLIAPAVIVGYIAVVIGRHEVQEIARHLPRGVEALEHKTEMVEMFLVNQIEYLVSWLAFCISFGAICSAVQQIETGMTPSFQNSFAAVRQKTRSFLRLSLLLYFILLPAVVAASLLFWGVVWFARQRHVHLSHFTIQLVSFTIIGLALLVFSRFGLAMPAFILDSCGVAQAMFRSDELTENKWLTLAALLAKSLVGGYVAGMCPFWVASWIPASVSLPVWFPWVLRVASVAAVIVVEPPMFIGFALLYIRMSATSSETIAPWRGVPVSPPPPSFTT